MKTYALVRDGAVVSVEPEFIEVDGTSYGLKDRMHPDVVKQCIELRGGQIVNVAPGYTYDGERFAAPVMPPPSDTEPSPAPAPDSSPMADALPTKEELMESVTRMSANLAGLVDYVDGLED